MSGQSPIKVLMGLRYLIFSFGEEFWKSKHLVNPFMARGYLIFHESRTEVKNSSFLPAKHLKLINGIKKYVKKNIIIEDNILRSQ